MQSAGNISFCKEEKGPFLLNEHAQCLFRRKNQAQKKTH